MSYLSDKSSVYVISAMTDTIFSFGIFRAGDFKDLKAGFHAKDDGALFNASIGLCSTGGIPDFQEDNTAKKK